MEDLENEYPNEPSALVPNETLALGESRSLFDIVVDTPVIHSNPSTPLQLLESSNEDIDFSPPDATSTPIKPPPKKRCRVRAGSKMSNLSDGRGRGNMPPLLANVGRGRGQGRGRPVVQPNPADIFIWDENKRERREFGFTGTPGVQVQPSDLTCPLSVVKTFLTDDIIRQIVEHTNSYADVIKNTPRIVERVNHTKRSIFQLWKNVDEDEIWLYICITLLMGIIHKPMYHMYWTTDCIFSTPIFSRLMRRDRFEQIRSMIHFVDPLQEDPTDSLRKLSSYIEQLQEKFCTNYVPQKYIAVDEYLSLWKGRLGFRQYIPSKRERYGVK